MPNGGFDGTPEEWEKLEKPLKAMDAMLDDFAKVHSLEITKNYHNWPGRILRWGEGIIRQIEIYLSDESKVTYNIALCAYEDRENKRYWKHISVKKDAAFSEIAGNLAQLLSDGRETLDSLKEDDLEEAGTIQDPWRASLWGALSLDLSEKFLGKK